MCDLGKGTSIIVNTCRIIKLVYFPKTLIIKISNWWKIRTSATLTGHFHYFILKHILQLSGVPTTTKTILQRNCLNIQIECGWCSYCSSFCNFKNWCFRDAHWLIILQVATIFPAYQLDPVSSVSSRKRCKYGSSLIARWFTLRTIGFNYASISIPSSGFLFYIEL